MESQVIEGYLCQCGFTSQDKNEFNGHLLSHAVKEPGVHKSAGRVNIETGEIILPPYNERSVGEKRISAIGRKKEKGDKSDKKIQQTEILSHAQQINFVPRSYTIDYSPILRAAQDASIRFWNWRPDMPLGNFLDTCLYMLFKDRGITLAGYLIEETSEEQAEREARINKKEAG